MPPSERGILSDGTVACVGCGAIHAGATALVRRQQETIGLLNREHANDLARIAQMQGDQVRKLSASPHYPKAKDVLSQWQMLCAPRTREPFNEPRLKAVIARLKGDGQTPGYTPAQLLVCAMGYAHFPYVVDGQRRETGRPDERYVDATLIFRSAGHVDRGIALWERIPPDQRVPRPIDEPEPSDGGDEALSLFEAA